MSADRIIEATYDNFSDGCIELSLTITTRSAVRTTTLTMTPTEAEAAIKALQSALAEVES